MARRRRRNRRRSTRRRNPGKLPWLWILGGGAALFLLARKRAEKKAVTEIAKTAEVTSAQAAQGEYIAVG